MLYLLRTYFYVPFQSIIKLTRGATAGGGGRPSEWYLAASEVAYVLGAAPNAGRHWKGGAGCHTLPGGVGGLRDVLSCQADRLIGSVEEKMERV